MTFDIKNSFGRAFDGKTVLVTGHTGFKGSWLSVWLHALGAKVIGYSLDPPTKPSNFELSHVKENMVDVRGDVRDYEHLLKTIQTHKPEVVFHLAAQAIILAGIQDPKPTFDTNVQGTLNVLEAVRKSPFVKAVVSITSDKCYKNQESVWGYRENDLLGGEDPYSASKAMAELAIESYQRSYFNKRDDLAGVASVRAGNVIGGGDFAEFRLVPDVMKALINKKEIRIRNPASVRPWQHVLIPLSGYLTVAAALLRDKTRYSHAWNFGPLEINGVNVQKVVEKIISFWGEGKFLLDNPGEKVETSLLKLNWERAAYALSWAPAYDLDESLAETVKWFKAYEQNLNSENKDMRKTCEDQIYHYTLKAREKNLAWTQ